MDDELYNDGEDSPRFQKGRSMVDKQGELLNYLKVPEGNKTLKPQQNGLDPGNMEDDEQSTGKKWVYGEDFEEESKIGDKRGEENDVVNMSPGFSFNDRKSSSDDGQVAQSEGEISSTGETPVDGN